jgi:membrane-bound lytic murein transglycosylase D
MGTRLPAKTDTVMVNKNVHLEQVAEVVGINIDLLRSLNPMYRRDIIPGATEAYALRLPLTEVGKFIELQDSVYNYKVDELLNKRSEVEIKDDVPTYYKKSKRSYKRRSARYKSRKSSTRKRKSSTRRRSSRARRRR